MHIVTKATNFQVTEALSDYVEKKLGPVKKFVDAEDETVAFIDVELGKSTNHHRSGDIFRAEVNFCIKGKCYRASSEKDNIYSAIDDIKDEITRELVKDKDKRQNIIHRSGAKMKEMIRGVIGNE
jgi:putative sigma-54 modulation protein